MQVTGRNIPNMIKLGGVIGSSALILLLFMLMWVGGFVVVCVLMGGWEYKVRQLMGSPFFQT